MPGGEQVRLPGVPAKDFFMRRIYPSDFLPDEDPLRMPLYLEEPGAVMCQL